MTSPDDGSRDGSHDDPANGIPEPATGSDLPRDFDAAWQAIIDNYGDRPSLAEPVEPPQPASRPAAAVDPALFDRSHLDAVDSTSPDEVLDRDGDEHFVPPEPPPVPRGTPARRLAWSGLFLPPVLMLLAVVFGWTFAPWVSLLLVVGFIGGFGFLVATMPRERGEGDDGAVV